MIEPSRTSASPDQKEHQQKIPSSNKMKIMQNPQKVMPQVVMAIVGSWGYFCMGGQRGWSSPGLPSLNRTRTFDLDPSDNKWISSIPMISSMIGALLVGAPMQMYGRKKALVIHYLMYILGFGLIGFAYFIEHKAAIYIGRIITGFGAGATTPVCQIYLSECSSPRIRGRLGSFTASSMALGILVTYIVGAFVEWYVLAWVLGGLPVIFLIWTTIMPETPVWLLTHDQEEEARLSLKYLRGKQTNVEGEFLRIKENGQTNQPGQGGIQLKDFMAGPVLKPMSISLAIMLFQQTTGINGVVFYTVSIFQSAGSTLDGRYATIIVGFVQLVFTVASGFLVDRFGRRMLLMTSSFFTSIALAALGIFFHFQRSWGEAEATEKLGWLPLVSLIVFFIAYSGGMSNVPFIIMGEMFPSRFRALLGTISSSFNLCCTFLIVRFFPDMMDGFGKDGTFYFFTGCTLFSILFVYFLLPETKGKTLEDMEKLFSNNNNIKTSQNNTDVIATALANAGVTIISNGVNLMNRSQNSSDDQHLAERISSITFDSSISKL